MSAKGTPPTSLRRFSGLSALLISPVVILLGMLVVGTTLYVDARGVRSQAVVVSTERASAVVAPVEDPRARYRVDWIPAGADEGSTVVLLTAGPLLPSQVAGTPTRLGWAVMAAGVLIGAIGRGYLRWASDTVADTERRQPE